MPKYSFISSHSIATVALEFDPLLYTVSGKSTLFFADVYECLRWAVLIASKSNFSCHTLHIQLFRLAFYKLSILAAA
jgi:hypothetical protein